MLVVVVRHSVSLLVTVAALAWTVRADACKPSGPSKPTDPVVARLATTGRDLPRNTHLWLAESWSAPVPPHTTLELRKVGSSTSVPVRDERILFGGARLHELIPAAELDRGSYELFWSAEAPGTPLAKDTFRFTVRDALDQEPPRWSATHAHLVAHTRENDGCNVGPRRWETTNAAVPVDDTSSAGDFVYLLWLPEYGDDLVDLGADPNGFAFGAAGDQVELASSNDPYIGVQVIDAAGHRLPPRELSVGEPRQSPLLRAARLGGRHVAAWVEAHPWHGGGALFAALVIVSAIARRKKAP